MPTVSPVLESPAAMSPAVSLTRRRALLFFLSGQESYRQPLFSPDEIFCGPDAADRREGDRIRAVKTDESGCDVRRILARLPGDQQPEFVVVKADATGRNFPRHLAAVRGPRVLLVGDTHHLARPIQSLIQYAREEPFDAIIFDHTRHHACFFAEAGLRNLHWLPALDYGFEPRALRSAPSRPLTFVGQVGRFHPYRRWVLQQIQAAGLPLQTLRGRLADTADIYADSQVTLNISLNGDLNLRVFEALAAGGFLLTDELGEGSGLRRLFEPGRHLDTWRTPGELREKIAHYLAHPAEAQRIRQAGQAELLRRHHPDVKLREFYDLIDGAEPAARYDLRSEPWWPRAAAVPAPGLPRELMAYEALQEIHRTARQVTVFASDPAALARFNHLPRLAVAPLAALAASRVDEEGGPPSARLLWWDPATPEEALAAFGGDCLLAPDEAAAARPEARAWGFVPESADSPVLTLADPCRFLDTAWQAGARTEVAARVRAWASSSPDSNACVVFSHYAGLLGDTALQQAALRRAIALDRNNLNALLALAAMMGVHGDASSVAVLLQEASRIGPLPPAVEALRRELVAQPGRQRDLGFYFRAIGGVPPGIAAAPRRILIITNLFPPQELGGYGRKMWEFAQGLRDRGHSVRVLTADQPALAKAPTPEEAALEALVSRTLPLLGAWQGGIAVPLAERREIHARAAAIVASIGAALADFRPEAVFLGNMDFLEHLPIQAALGAGLPVLHALGNARPGYAVGRQPRSPRYWVGACSDWTGEGLREAGYAPGRIETLYPGARVDRFFRFFLPDPGRLRICFAGLVLPFKGVHVLVDALIRLHRAGVDFTAELAGDAPDAKFLAQMQATLAAAGLAEKVRFTGFLDRSALAALFARNNVLVFPTLTPEPFGISHVEAMAAGLVVVSSGTGGAKEIVRPNLDGLISEAGRGDELARQLFSLLQDPPMMERLQRAGQTRAMGFAVEHSVTKIERLFEELLALPADPAPTHAGPC
jgi:glycosyltransferase involved in cell wall biosynthesis